MHTGTLDTGFFCAYRTRPTTAVLCAITVHLYTARMCVRSQPRCHWRRHSMASPVLVVLGLIHRQHLDISEGVLLGWCAHQISSSSVDLCKSIPCRLRRLVTTRARTQCSNAPRVAHWVQPSETLDPEEEEVASKDEQRRHKTPKTLGAMC